MAAALMRAKNLPFVEVLSGGTDPGSALNAEAQTAVGELGVTMDGEFPKAISDEVFMSVGRIVILGNEAKLSPVAGIAGTIETWLTPEPGPEVGDKLAQTRIVRDDIVRRVNELAEVLSR
jgi:arsenate-mycothiol transferase